MSTRIPIAFLGLGALGFLFAPLTGEPRASLPLDAAPASEGRAALRKNGAAVVEPEREIPVTHRADVVVVGATVGGLGGCMAAVAAARQGAETILIEESGHIDPHVPIGLGVVIGIEGWRPAIREGLCRDFVRHIVEMGQHYYQPLTEDEVLARGEIIIRYHEVVTTAMLKLLQDAGVKMLFHARAAGAVVEDGKLQALIIESPQGRHAVAGKVFVDSTGLGDVAALAGAPMLREEPFMGVQAFISGVDEGKYRRWLEQDGAPLDASYRQWLEKEVGPFEALEFPWNQWWPEFLGDRMPPAVVRKAREAHARGEFTVRYQRGKKGVLAIPEGIKTDPGVARPRTYITGVDPLNADDVSWAETTSRLALMEFQRFLRKYIPGFEACVMERMADEVSLRGGRYIESEHNIIEEEINRGEKNPDCIFLFQRGKERPAFEVPYSALLPKRIEGLLVVGKATAGGRHLRTAHAVLFQGQAAGTAAAMAVREGIPPRGIKIKALQEALKKAGVEIPY